jgi:hypothetical protein
MILKGDPGKKTSPQELKILITVKTYPIPSKKYDELVCTAGVTEKGDFIRLYPINFRDLPFSHQYKLGEPIPTKRGDWSERARYALAKKSASMEDLYEQQEKDRTSLGVFRPKKIHDLTITPDDPEWDVSFKEALMQARLWETRTISKEPPRKVPFKFHYRFECDDHRCKGNHRMMIEDWELGALFWKLADNGDSHKKAAEKVRNKFLNEICGQDKDTHFFVGTILSYPKTWVIIGVFWPKQSPDSYQKELAFPP